MSAHRRPTLRDETTSRALRPTLRDETTPRPAPVAGSRRRTRSKPYRLLPIALGFALLGFGVAAGPSVVGGAWSSGNGGQGNERIKFAALPKDAPDQGLVYEGLKAADAGSLCAGSYELDPQTCTHGPDTAPAGLKVRRDVAPITAKAPEPIAPAREGTRVPSDAEIVRDEGGSALIASAPALIPDAAPGEADFIMGTHGVACEGDGRTGKRVQVLYLHEFGTPSRYTDFLGSIRTWSAQVDAIFDASAAETGGSRHIRFVTTPQCRVDVAEVQVPETALGSFSRNIDALQTLGYNRTDRKYLIFADTNVYCGIGSYIGDKRAGLGNRNNGGPAYGRVDAGCWSSTMAAHELTHSLGAVLQGSPNSSGAGSCTDDYDLLCGRDRSNSPIRTVCPRKHENRLDCGHDDYFSTNPKPNSYLAQNWNVAQSEYLLRSDGGDDIPDAGVAAQSDADSAADAPAATPPAAVPDPTAPTAAPQPTGGQADDDGQGPPAPEVTETAPTTPAEGGEPAGDTAEVAHRGAKAKAQVEAVAKVQAVLEVRDPTSTAVRMTWSAAAPTATYEVAVNGVKIATTVATRAQLIGLRPDTKYLVTVRNAAHGYLAKSSAQTAPAARPAQNSWFVLTNSLTGGAADLYAARTALGTAVTLSGAEGDAQQQWKLVPAGDGAYSLRSRATGKCVGPLGGNWVAGTPLVQGDCDSTDSQRWSLQASDYGFTLRTSVGELVAGVGVQRFGAHRLLVLQEANGSRHQSWTAVPG